MGYSDMGIRLGVEGERDFKAALRDINQAFKVLGSSTTPRRTCANWPTSCQPSWRAKSAERAWSHEFL